MTKTKHNRANEAEKSGKIFPIMELLPVGKENAISTADLLRRSGCSSARELQQRIAYERSQGAIICSGSSRGYWRPKSDRR